MGNQYKKMDNVTRRIEVPISGISEDGSFYGTVNKEMREEIDFDELMENSDEVDGYAVIFFK